MPIPIMLLGDAATCRSGLGRHLRDVATRIATDMPELRVATIGYAGAGSVHLPFPQYCATAMNNWVISELPGVWHDFAQGERGILLSIWDVSRLAWLVDPPKTFPFADWLKNPPFRRWIYPAVDAEGPHGKLPHALQQVMNKFDRVLNYSQFSSRVTGHPQYLPHGIDTSVFYRRPNAKAKFRENGFTNLPDNSVLVGIVATNQVRKDWALGIQTVAALRDRGHNVRLWCHTDVVSRHWNLEQLIQDYNLVERVCVTTDTFPDEQMAEMYSACDLTLGIGQEGFGYPLAESLACRVPVVHGDYGGGAEVVPYEMLVSVAEDQDGDPIYRHEGTWCSRRPVFRVRDWVYRAECLIGGSAMLPARLDWNNLWPKWKQWLKEGINESGSIHRVRSNPGAVPAKPGSLGLDPQPNGSNQSPVDR